MKTKSDATVEPPAQESTAKALTFEHVSAPLSTDRRNSTQGVVGGEASAVPRRARPGAAPGRAEEAARSESRRTTRKAPCIVVGFDSEYEREGVQNRVLCYSFHAQIVGGPSWGGVIYCQNGKRLKLASLLRQIIEEGRKAGHLRRWPKALTLVGHWTLSDLAMLEDFSKLKHQFSSIRNTYVTLQQPLDVAVLDSSNHRHVIAVTLRDTMLLSPGGSKTLDSLGDLLGEPKVELPDGQIDRMEELLQQDPDLFERYAKQDPKICVAHALLLLQLNEELTGRAEVPVTLSGLGEAFLLRLWESKGVSRQKVLGVEELVETAWNRALGHLVPRKVVKPVLIRHLFESLASECFHGGLNVQFLFGAGPIGTWFDVDLVGAYTTAMSMIGMPDWQRLRSSTNLDDYGPLTLGFAYIRFSFPPDTTHPCLPVATAHGPLFPLSGESCCCAPEIYLARKLGAVVEILHGAVLPVDDTVRPFELFVQECTRRRSQFPKGEVMNALYKELANSTYGRIAQGARPKRAFDSRTGQPQWLRPGRISNSSFAAWITSYIRAVMSEMLNALPPHVVLCSATTDGFLSTATEADIVAATQGELCRAYSLARQRLTGDPKIYEVKHRIAQPLGIRTRGQATLVALPGEPIVLARAGIKPPMKDTNEQNDWLINEFLKRTPETRLPYSQLRSLQDLHRDSGDLISVMVTRRASLDFDFKREPIGECMRDIRGVSHLAFDTRPWLDVDAFLKCRADWDVFRRTRVLKTVADLEEFRAFCATPSGPRTRTSKPGGAVKVSLRMFLRAYVRNRWGLDSSVLNYPELADWLTAAGYPCRPTDLENANRSSTKLVEHSVAGTPAVLAFIKVITEQFPGFQGHHLFTHDAKPGQFPSL